MMQHSHYEEQLSAMLRSHVERTLQDGWQERDLTTDEDGDYPFRSSTSSAWVCIISGEEPAVRVMAHAAVGVPKSARLLTEINDLNLRGRWTKVAWSHGVVMVESTVHWSVLNSESLTRAVDAVTTVADDIGVMLAAVYGGSTPYPYEVDTVDEEEDAA